MHDFMCQQNRAFAWNDTEKGRFRPDFFPPIDIPVIPHIPFIERNIPIPPGIYDEVCAIIKKKSTQAFMNHPTLPIDRAGFVY